ncbi:hypothetical protein GMDG_07313 [Pseudogymnoascus destructans 20631-21]|uniref:Uncharacterized protein n=1 Tax=Pseudogymnoascus destructans (strain ATCC MYA-4855 / 20631-21) TaxID=658429 RepID=L8FWK3_PSED2|nr:hypothetical protein GMDG_07313 [Pseudogymnoascus destructans 20631-21]
MLITGPPASESTTNSRRRHYHQHRGYEGKRVTTSGYSPTRLPYLQTADRILTVSQKGTTAAPRTHVPVTSTLCDGERDMFVRVSSLTNMSTSSQPPHPHHHLIPKRSLLPPKAPITHKSYTVHLPSRLELQPPSTTTTTWRTTGQARCRRSQINRRPGRRAADRDPLFLFLSGCCCQLMEVPCSGM